MYYASLFEIICCIKSEENKLNVSIYLHHNPIKALHNTNKHLFF